MCSMLKLFSKKNIFINMKKIWKKFFLQTMQKKIDLGLYFSGNFVVWWTGCGWGRGATPPTRISCTFTPQCGQCCPHAPFFYYFYFSIPSNSTSCSSSPFSSFYFLLHLVSISLFFIYLSSLLPFSFISIYIVGKNSLNLSMPTFYIIKKKIDL